MNRKNHDKRNRDGFFDHRLDQLIETGRQVVDGVAGNRPGKRNQKYLDQNPLSSFNNVGRWVEDKLEWLIEEEENWMEEQPLHSEQTIDSSASKRPLEAISLRKSNQQSDQSYIKKLNPKNNEDEWPDEETFMINKWQRDNSNQRGETIAEERRYRVDSSIKKRPLPRSSRKRL